MILPSLDKSVSLASRVLW